MGKKGQRAPARNPPAKRATRRRTGAVPTETTHAPMLATDAVPTETTTTTRPTSATDAVPTPKPSVHTLLLAQAAVQVNPFSH